MYWVWLKFMEYMEQIGLEDVYCDRYVWAYREVRVCDWLECRGEAKFYFNYSDNVNPVIVNLNCLNDDEEKAKLQILKDLVDKSIREIKLWEIQRRKKKIERDFR